MGVLRPELRKVRVIRSEEGQKPSARAALRSFLIKTDNVQRFSANFSALC